MLEARFEDGLTIAEGDGLRIRQLREGGFAIQRDCEPELYYAVSLDFLMEEILKPYCDDEQLKNIQVCFGLTQ